MSSIRKLAIEGEFTIFSAQALKSRLLLALAESSETQVDLSGVTDIDSAGIQLMVAAKREATNRGQILHFTGHSPAVIETLDRCDLTGHFGDPVLISRGA